MGVRQQRLADEIRDIIGSCFLGGQLEDPSLRNVTITAVKLTGDLQLASVYFRIYGESIDVAAARKGLERATGLFRHKLAEALEIRRLPALRYFYDESLDRGSRIEELLAQAKR